MNQWLIFLCFADLVVQAFGLGTGRRRRRQRLPLQRAELRVRQPGLPDHHLGRPLRIPANHPLVQHPSRSLSW